MKSGIDQAIVEVYASFPLPPDQIVCQPGASADFTNLVNARLPEGEQTDVATVNKRLLNLRRRGQDKGGLPRRWRNFNGRNN